MKLIFLLLVSLSTVSCLLPPKFQWKYIDFNWGTSGMTRQAAMKSGDYRPESNMPTGIARWRDKLFLTIPRWKKGVPSCLNYVSLEGDQSPLLNPYPSWKEAFVKADACCIKSNATIMSAFRMHIDCCDRLWVVDNGVADMAIDVRQIIEPAVVIFDLRTDTVIKKFVLPDDVLEEKSILTSIVVDVIPDKKKCKCNQSFAYITDMGGNAIIVYSFHDDEAWRIEHPFFSFDPKAGIYSVGGVNFYWNDGISSAALTKADRYGERDLYFQPTSSTKQFKMSTRLLRRPDVSTEDIVSGIMKVGDKGPLSQTTACAYDPVTNVLFFTQLSKNGLACWNLGKTFNEENCQCILSDCMMLEFPNDIKVDDESNLWMLSDRQSRFLYQDMDFVNEINFRVLTAPVSQLIAGTPCEKSSRFFKRKSYN